MSDLIISFYSYSAPVRTVYINYWTFMFNMMSVGFIEQELLATRALELMLIYQHFVILVHSFNIWNKFLATTRTRKLSSFEIIHTESTDYLSAIKAFSAFIREIIAHFTNEPLITNRCMLYCFLAI